jgi:hypothetical protein
MPTGDYYPSERVEPLKSTKYGTIDIRYENTFDEYNKYKPPSSRPAYVVGFFCDLCQTAILEPAWYRNEMGDDLLVKIKCHDKQIIYAISTTDIDNMPLPLRIVVFKQPKYIQPAVKHKRAIDLTQE